MFDSTDTLSAVSADSSVREAAVEAPAATFYIGDTPILRGKWVLNINNKIINVKNNRKILYTYTSTRWFKKLILWCDI